jgi:hypothetical protein
MEVGCDDLKWMEVLEDSFQWRASIVPGTLGSATRVLVIILKGAQASVALSPHANYTD